MAETDRPAAPDCDTPHSIILRPLPKVIFFYPTMLASFIIGAWQAFASDSAETAGLVFFALFALNLLVIAFEFSRLKSVAIFCLLLAGFFLFLYLGDRFPVLEYLREFLARLHIQASTSFYLALGSYFLVVFIGVFINSRWNYFEVQHNMIVRHHGFLGDIQRYPSPNLKMTKEISDVFEFLLLGSGRIILYPASEKEAIVIDNVRDVNRVEVEMKKLLSRIAVEMSGGGDEHHQQPEDH